jgi:hypothetical protein
MALEQFPNDIHFGRNPRRAGLPAEGLAEVGGLDAKALCSLLLQLDARALPETPALFPGAGPQVTPLFRGLGAELLLVRWCAGQTTGVQELGDSEVAVRPLEGSLRLQTYRPVGRKLAELLHMTHVGPEQLIGVPRGSVHELIAVTPGLSLHLCSPPVVVRTRYEVVTS